MGSKSLVICDPEEHYAQALAFYIMNRKGIHFQVQVCSNLEYIKDADLLLISDEFSDEERNNVKAKKVFVLTGRGKMTSQNDVIFKYQPGEQILDEILTQCEAVYEEDELFFTSSQKKNGKIIGVFSPVHRIGKTSYALNMGEEMALSANVLYLNLELYGGIGGHFEKGGQTLEDVLYYARQEKGNLGFMLTKVVKRKGNLDYILPAPVSEDIKDIRAKEWVFLLKQIIDQSIYETMILDIDEGIRDVYELLDICTEIHLLMDQTPYSQAKVEQFERELTLLGYEEMLSKIMRMERLS